MVEAGEYAQRAVYHIADSLEAAVRAIRGMYAAGDPPSVIAESDPPRPEQWSERTWGYTVTILEQCGHKLVSPMRSEYDITEWPVSQ